MVRFVLEEFDVAWLKGRLGLSEPTRCHIDWRIARIKKAFGTVADQMRPLYLALYQDDVVAVTISAELAHWIELWMTKILGLELELALSTKTAATQPFESVFKVFGYTLHLSVKPARYTPRAPLLAKLREWQRRVLVEP